MFEGAVGRARAEARAHGRQGTVALGAFLIGALLVLVAGQARWLWTRGAIAAIGLVLIAAALMWFHDHLLRIVDPLDRRERRALWFAFPGLLGAAALIFGVAIWNGWLVLGVLAVGAAAVAAMGTHVVLRIDADGGVGDGRSPVVRHPLRSLWLPADLIVAGIGAVWATTRFGLIAWLGLGAALVGTILLKQQMASLVHTRRLDWRVAAHVSADVAVVGVLLVWRGAATGAQLAVLGGVALAFCGFSVFGIALLYLRRSPRVWVVVLVLAAAALTAGWWWTGSVLGERGWAALLVAFIGVVGAWFVFRGEAVIAVVLVGALGLWGLAPGYSKAPADPHPDADVRLLVLGDSFISGEGADAYLRGTNQVGGDDRNECRRAPTAYGYRIAREQGYGLDFLACSGATTEDLLSCGQMATGALRCRPSEAWAADPPEPDAVPGDRPQLFALPDEDLAEVDAVLVSIGGNDVGFSTIVQACLLPRSCAERAQQWFANVDAVGAKLTATYAAIRARFPGVPVVVVPYPLLVDPDDPCGKGLDDGEYTFVADFTRHLDRQIAASAEAAGVIVWEDGVEAYFADGRDHRMCTDDPGVNHLSLDPPNGAPTGRYLPLAWIHNSMHPNPLGHRVVAGQLTPFLADVLAGVVPMPEPAAPPEPAVEQAAAVPAEPYVDLSAPGEPVLTDGEWIAGELYRTTHALLLPTIVVLVASLFVALALINLPGPQRLLRPGRTWRAWDDEPDAGLASAP